jgi:hypothetical protein
LIKSTFIKEKKDQRDWALERRERIERGKKRRV